MPRFFSLALAFSLAMGFGTAGLEPALAETQSVIDPVEAPEPQRPPASRAKDPPRPDETVKRERRRADEQQRRRASAEARELAAANEAAKLRAIEESRRADAAAREVAARAAARKAEAARAATARAAAAKVAKAKAAEAARKEALRQAAARDAAARKVAAREAVAREARETAAREAAAREVAAREAAAKEAREVAAREAAAREAAAKEAAARELAAREAAAREAKAREAAVREAAAREAAAREAAAREAAVREAAAREAAAREATAREAAAKEAATREAAVRGARLAAGHETLGADSRTANGPPYLKVFRDCAECPEVVWLPKGELPPGLNAAGGPRYALKVSYVLAVGRFKVSIAEWDACVADRGCRRRPDGAGWGRGRDPVTNVSWEDAQQYATWLSRRTSKPYRLLTGPEWEYAARTGSEVYDMHGGVSEWVENCYQYRDARNGNGGWKLECTNQTLRGGAQRDAVYRTGVNRSFAPFNHYDDRIGFRIARTE
ncbi:MAG TPA: formylglycine-generating enzyme family protein [Burkholderiales bacterium]|nr:formylglycine-generating enzyme family protein [Burkholderiales bacterium]